MNKGDNGSGRLAQFCFHAAVKTKLVVTQNTYSVLFCEKFNNLLLTYHESSGAHKTEPSCLRYALPTRIVLMLDYKKHRSNRWY